MNDRMTLKPGEIVAVDASDPLVKKVRTMRDDFLQIAQAHGATTDEYGSALVAAIAAVIYGSARGDVVERNVRVNMLVRGLDLHFAQYERAGGYVEAVRRDLQARRG